MPERIELYGVYNLTHVSQVYIMFQGKLAKPEFAPGPKSLDVKLVEAQDIPWDDMAFKVVTMTLERYFRDRKKGHFPAYTDDVIV